ncbi:Aspartic-type endopeptidase ctsD [Penicillium chermesinum]|uniref:penicillopepsin n=1 Tax=Penicillium chermesinum TaxID=63820 RepID=A0A9W9P637_9EURO|nr:Aspartic-type endopeptidase ctsD [Penicillium chermesinum]KAJ5238520.1 Aspartic-type endopeptidase ctsD [Penicillium chermesinum]KAJ6164173.1 Aspartic-type endopeptidase ctsD [Penicillium chermesinum]
MRFSSCLVIAGLSSSVHAFYPWEIKVEESVALNSRDNERRFMPWKIKAVESEEENADDKPFTLGIKKAPVRRDDKYTIIRANDPTLPHSAALDQDGADFSYFSVVEVGSQKTQMWLAVDTGSPSTWVFDSACTDTVCTNHHTFDSKASTSFISNNSEISIGYGSGTIKGGLGQDTVSIAGLNATLSFGQATSASQTFNNYPIDGILGLGRSRTAGWNIPSFMDVVGQSGVLPANLVGFSLSRASEGGFDGEVNFGGVDTTKFDGTISYSTTVTDIWSIALDDAYVNGKALGFQGKIATIDTGTTYILIPPNDAKILFAAIPDSSFSGGNWVVPCDASAKLELSFAGIKYSIEPEDYIGSQHQGSGCVSTIISQESSGPDTWLVGDVFLKNVYSVFDFDNAQIGFGTRNATSVPGNGTFVVPTATATTLTTVAPTATATGTTSSSESPSPTPMNSASSFSISLIPSIMVVGMALLI